MGVPMSTFPDADLGIPKEGVAPVHGRKAANDMRRRRRAHRKGVLVSIHPRCLMGTRGSASAPGDGRCTVAAL